MKRLKKVLLIALIPLLLVGWLVWREAARWRDLRAFVTLSDALDRDLSAFEAQVRERPPLREPRETGSAEEYYFRAAERVGESFDGDDLPLPQQLLLTVFGQVHVDDGGRLSAERGHGDADGGAGGQLSRSYCLPQHLDGDAAYVEDFQY